MTAVGDRLALGAAGAHARLSVRNAANSLAKALEIAGADWADSTRAKYGHGLLRFAHFVGADTVTDGLLHLVELGPLDGHLRAHEWRQGLMEDGLSASYVAQHVAALKAGWRLVRRVGLATWDLELKSPKVSALRDTRGPSLAEVHRLVSVASERADVHGMRDRALVLLFAVLALRRVEVWRMDVEDFEQQSGRLKVLGKGRDDWECITAPPAVADGLIAYVKARDAKAEEPLFTSHDRRAKSPQRLSPSGMFRVIRRLGELAGLERPLAPHQLRHFAITQALEETGGDVRRVKAFSRHRKLETVLVYDDRRRNHQAEIADVVAAAVTEPRTKEHDAAPCSTSENSGSDMVTGMGVSVTITAPEGLTVQGPADGQAAEGETPGRRRSSFTLRTIRSLMSWDSMPGLDRTGERAP